MNEFSRPNSDEDLVRELLERWARATRKGLRPEEILANHDSKVLVYDVLSPMKYEGAAAYSDSWDDWQPDTQGEGQFSLQNLSVTAGKDVAFARYFIQCGGTAPDGEVFEDLVRATFCLRKTDGSWKIAHQHISKPIEPSSRER